MTENVVLIPKTLGSRMDGITAKIDKLVSKASGTNGCSLDYFLTRHGIQHPVAPQLEMEMNKLLVLAQDAKKMALTAADPVDKQSALAKGAKAFQMLAGFEAHTGNVVLRAEYLTEAGLLLKQCPFGTSKCNTYYSESQTMFERAQSLYTYLSLHSKDGDHYREEIQLMNTYRGEALQLENKATKLMVEKRALDAILDAGRSRDWADKHYWDNSG